jgi:hypothetical protein
MQEKTSSGTRLIVLAFNLGEPLMDVSRSRERVVKGPDTPDGMKQILTQCVEFGL